MSEPAVCIPVAKFPKEIMDYYAEDVASNSTIWWTNITSKGSSTTACKSKECTHTQPNMVKW